MKKKAKTQNTPNFTLHQRPKDKKIGKQDGKPKAKDLINYTLQERLLIIFFRSANPSIKATFQSKKNIYI